MHVTVKKTTSNSWATGDLDPRGLTVEQLERHLVTCDYRGRAYKKLCFDEVRRRAKWGWLDRVRGLFVRGKM